MIRGNPYGSCSRRSATCSRARAALGASLATPASTTSLTVPLSLTQFGNAALVLAPIVKNVSPNPPTTVFDEGVTWSYGGVKNGILIDTGSGSVVRVMYSSLSKEKGSWWATQGNKELHAPWDPASKVYTKWGKPATVARNMPIGIAGVSLTTGGASQTLDVHTVLPQVYVIRDDFTEDDPNLDPPAPHTYSLASDQNIGSNVISELDMYNGFFTWFNNPGVYFGAPSGASASKPLLARGLGYKYTADPQPGMLRYVVFRGFSSVTPSIVMSDISDVLPEPGPQQMPNGVLILHRDGGGRVDVRLQGASFDVEVTSSLGDYIDGNVVPDVGSSIILDTGGGNLALVGKSSKSLDTVGKLEALQKTSGIDPTLFAPVVPGSPTFGPCSYFCKDNEATCSQSTILAGAVGEPDSSVSVKIVLKNLPEWHGNSIDRTYVYRVPPNTTRTSAQATIALPGACVPNTTSPTDALCCQYGIQAGLQLFWSNSVGFDTRLDQSAFPEGYRMNIVQE